MKRYKYRCDELRIGGSTYKLYGLTDDGVDIKDENDKIIGIVYRSGHKRQQGTLLVYGVYDDNENVVASGTVPKCMRDVIEAAIWVAGVRNLEVGYYML